MKLLGIIFLVIGLAICASPDSSKNKCTNPQVEIMGTKWALYQNLIPIPIRKCEIKKIITHLNCKDEALERHRTVIYYDTSKNCRNLIEKQSSTATPCQNGLLRKEKQINNVVNDTGKVSLETNKLFLPNGFACQYTMGFCYDSANVGYMWEVSLKDNISCSNLIRLINDEVVVVKFSVDREYMVFEGNSTIAVELVEQQEICGEKVWTDKKGLFFTNDTSFKLRSRNVKARIDVGVPEKQSVYERLVADCEKNEVITESFYYYATFALLAYVLLHIIFSIFCYLTNCTTFKGRRLGTCNRSFMNESPVREREIKSDVPKEARCSSVSYYTYQVPQDALRTDSV